MGKRNKSSSPAMADPELASGWLVAFSGSGGLGFERVCPDGG